MKHRVLVSKNVVSQLPWQYQAWHVWCQWGPKRPGGGTFGGNVAFTAAKWLSRLVPTGEDNLIPVRFPPGLTVYVDCLDFEFHQHAIKSFSRGDKELSLLRRILRAGDVFVDVGANLGTLALPAASCVGPTGTVLAVEPQPRLIAALGKSKKANSLAQLEIVDVALSDFVGTSDFFLSTSSSGTGSLNRQYTWSKSIGVSVEVQVMTLDVLLAARRLDGVRLIKLDVEGAELAVLRGAQRTLGRYKPFVLFEANRAAQNQAGLNAVFGCLRSAGYYRFLDSHELIEQTPTSIGQLTNILALPPGANLQLNS